MQRNKLKDIWDSGNPVLVGWCSIGNPFLGRDHGRPGL